MFSGSVRGAAKPITIVALEVYPTIGSAPADLMMSRALINAGSSTGRIPDCNRTAAHSSVLDGGVHTRLLGHATSTTIAVPLRQGIREEHSDDQRRSDEDR